MRRWGTHVASHWWRHFCLQVLWFKIWHKYWLPVYNNLMVFTIYISTLTENDNKNENDAINARPYHMQWHDILNTKCYGCNIHYHVIVMVGNNMAPNTNVTYSCIIQLHWLIRMHTGANDCHACHDITVIRIMTNSRYNAHTEPLFKQLYLLKVKDIFDVQCMKFWYKFVNKKLPIFFRDMFKYNHEVHDIGTRSHDQLHLYPTRTSGARNVLRHHIPELLNTFPK